MVDYVFERHLSGGILLPANKTTSTAGPIHRGFVPTKLVLALLQHRGNPAVPVVAVGQRVLKGQTIATADVGQPVFIPPIAANDQIYVVTNEARLVVFN